MAERSRLRRWLPALSVLAALLLVGAWWVNRQLEPERLTSTVLSRAGRSLGVEVRFSGLPEYALRPEPRIVIPDFSAGLAGSPPFLRARRAEISLPWDTITGGEPVITRVQLDGMVLDLPGFRRWQATRPQVPLELPTLVKGLVITDGAVVDDGFRIGSLMLELPRLKDGEPADARSSGLLTVGDTQLGFDLQLQLATVGLVSEYSLEGTGQLRQKPAPLPFKLASNGHLRVNDAGTALDARMLVFDGKSPLPSLDGKATLVSADRLQLRFDGVLAQWPETWPALPQPLATQAGKLPLKLDYIGKSDLSDTLSLSIVREPTSVQAQLQVPEILAWLDQPTGSPLPPLTGHMRTDRLVFDGVELQGVDVTVSESPAGRP